MQTLRNSIVPLQSSLPAQSTRLTFDLLDKTGDQLTGMLDRPSPPEITPNIPKDAPLARTGESPLIVLIHGLTGCEESSYVLETARFHLQRGRHILRLNMRGAGPGRNHAKGYYHAGCWPDIAAALSQLHEESPHISLIIIGYSLGGNVVLNLLAHLPPHLHVTAAATVSAPIVPLQASRTIMAPRNALYQRFLLNRMKSDVLASDSLDASTRTEIQQSRTVYGFDDQFVAPQNGFRDAPDYYAQTAGAQFVPEIATPLLMLHAANDPWIPTSPYRELQRLKRKTTRIQISTGGGHVGFHEQGHADTWHDRAIETFFITHAGLSPAATATDNHR